jgi:hypothetical protein
MVAMYAAGAAIHELAYALPQGRLGDDARALYVDLGVFAIRQVHLAECRRHVVDDVHALHATGDRGGISDGPDHDFRAEAAELTGLVSLLVVEDDDAPAFAEEPSHECATGHARPAGHQGLHSPVPSRLVGAASWRGGRCGSDCPATRINDAVAASSHHAFVLRSIRSSR